VKYQARFTTEARDELRRIDRKTALAILHKLAELEQDPMGYATTPVVTRPGHRRLRMGDYRVIYRVDQGALVVLVVHVGHRATVYDD
jgi:mRNA interferase RelE/StbE